MFFLVFVLLFSATTAFDETNVLSCWNGWGLAMAEEGVFGSFTKMNCSSKAKSCFSATFITVHGNVFAHRTGCADEGVSSLYDDGIEGVAKYINWQLCYKSGCNKPKKVTLDIQQGDIECVSELMGKISSQDGTGNDFSTNHFETFQLAPKIIRCSEYSSKCVSAKCVAPNTQKYNKGSFVTLKGCALPKTTKATLNSLCTKVLLGGKLEGFKFGAGTRVVDDELEGFNNGSTSVAIDFSN
ncbi:hypothetical protein GPALN_005758 [Globodera pallida]|nr:hypothetical protein GPALN_005758 [Globodera pallida]